ncbi:MAG: FliG C-terminal domain-containing protein [Elusimicrobiota bacterium]
MLNITAVLLIAALGAPPARAAVRTASSQDIVLKAALESSMEKRLETVLRKILGTDDVFVVANAELLSEAAAEHPDMEVLPGITVKKVPSAPAPMEMPSSFVKRIAINVFVDHSMSDENVELARKTTERLVGLRTERGDVLNVEKLGAPATGPAPTPETASRRTRFLDQAFQPTTLLLLAWLLAAVAGLVLVARRFFDPFVSVLRDAAQSMHRTDSARAAVAVEERASAEAKTATEAAPGAANEPSERKLPFSFIKERDLPALEMLLLEQSDAACAIVVQYLAPALASRTLAAMTAEKRERVLDLMASPALLDRNDVQKIEEIILTKIDYILGGEEKLVAIIDLAPIAMQTEILSIVRLRDPELGRRLARRVVLLEDIGLLDEAELALLNRAATVRGMAVVLKYSSSLRETVLPKLKGGLGEWLTQETALIGDLSEQAKEAELRRVLSAFVKLVREGKIVLRKDAPPPSDPGAGTEPSSETADSGVQ